MKELATIASNEIAIFRNDKVLPFIELVLVAVEAKWDVDSEGKTARSLETTAQRVCVPLDRLPSIIEDLETRRLRFEALLESPKDAVIKKRDPLAELRWIAKEIHMCYGEMLGPDHLNDNDEVNPAQRLTAGHLRRLKEALLLAGADV